MKRTPPEVRFWAKVEKDGEHGCWLWTGAISDTGYGAFRIDPARTTSTHRIAYEWANGPIPPGTHLDHLCRNKPCVNPGHLQAVTPWENSRRGKEIGYAHPSAVTTCKRGHDWSVTPPYLAHRSNGTVTRRCRACAYEQELSRKWTPDGAA